jgi:hypothetical protein
MHLKGEKLITKDIVVTMEPSGLNFTVAFIFSLYIFPGIFPSPNFILNYICGILILVQASFSTWAG